MAAALILFYFIFQKIDVQNSNIASVWFKDSVETENIRKQFAKGNHDIKIMIVPGHDEDSQGAWYFDVREFNMNLDLAERLVKLLESENNLDVFLTRDKDGYTAELKRFWRKNEEKIQKFVERNKSKMNKLVEKGKVDTYVNIHHNAARPEVVQKLYGINYFSNKENFDIVVHLHFNDYPGRKGRDGKYNGFSIYVPERQYSNSAASHELAQKISKQILGIIPPSSMPKEGAIVEDQELIAVGAFNTVEAASILIENGYIYERQFQDEEINDVVFEELANKIYIGLMDYLRGTNSGRDPYSALNKFDFEDKDLELDDTGLFVLALQNLLFRKGFYPPEGNLNDCPLTGKFGECTKKALEAFQKFHDLEETGFLDEETRDFIHDSYKTNVQW